MVRINFWKARVGPGHCSMHIGKGESPAGYVSWWPRASPTDGDLDTMLFGVLSSTCSYEEDVKRETAEPDQTVSIDGLNETQMRKAWHFYRDRMRYSFLAQNCATTVVDVLHGGGGTLSWPTKIMYLGGFMWTPQEAITFGHLINWNIDEIKKNIAAGKTPPLPDIAGNAYSRATPPPTDRPFVPVRGVTTTAAGIAHHAPRYAKRRRG